MDNNLVILIKSKNYIKQGNYFRAEKGCRKLLEPSMRSQHLSDFLTACLNNLSEALNNQGKYTEAAKIAKESLDICRSKLGVNHPITLESMELLARSYAQTAKIEEAYELLNECIERSMTVSLMSH